MFSEGADGPELHTPLQENEPALPAGLDIHREIHFNTKDRGVAEFISAHGVAHVVEQLQQNPDRFAIFEYHGDDASGYRHVNTVPRRADRILTNIVNNSQLTEEDVSRSVLKEAAERHDEDYEGYVRADRTNFDMLVLEAKPGEGEASSAAKLRASMEKQGYSEEDIEKGVTCIMATVPSFTRKGVVQEGLKQGAPVEAYALAAADLGACLDGEFAVDSDDLLRERFIGIKLILMRAQMFKDKPVTHDEKHMIGAAIQGWTSGQLGFIEHRLEQIKQDVKVLPTKGAQDEMFVLFNEKLRAAKDEMVEIQSRRTELFKEGEPTESENGSTPEPDSQWFQKLLKDCGYPDDLIPQA